MYLPGQRQHSLGAVWSQPTVGKCAEGHAASLTLGACCSQPQYLYLCYGNNELGSVFLRLEAEGWLSSASFFHIETPYFKNAWHSLLCITHWGCGLLAIRRVLWQDAHVVCSLVCLHRHTDLSAISLCHSYLCVRDSGSIKLVYSDPFLFGPRHVYLSEPRDSPG